MAKKRKKEKEEKYVFKLPEFDEVKFMEDEMLAAKVGVAVALFAIPMAAGSYALTLASLPIIAFFFGMGGMFLIKPYLQFLDFDTEEWEKKTWAGHGAMYFFTWLAVWVLLVNAPFTDLVGPSIDRVKVLYEGDEWSVNDGQAVEVTVNVTNASPILVEARVGDNSALRQGSITATVNNGPAVQMVPSGEPHVFRFTITDYTVGQVYSVTLSAADQAGHTTVFSFTILTV
jgi:hypothetical protein